MKTGKKGECKGEKRESLCIFRYVFVLKDRYKGRVLGKEEFGGI